MTASPTWASWVAATVVRATWSPRASAQQSWPVGKRAGFRFVFCYVVLYWFPYPLDVVPGAGGVADTCRAFVHGVAVAAFNAVTGSDVVVNNASSDSASNYVRVAMLLLVTALTTTLWSALDGRRSAYPALWHVLRTYLRYVVAAVMLGYGFEKVFGLQFPAPSPTRLAQPFGEASPMGLLWTFVGASPAYQFVSGAFEVVGGALLLFRRTTTLAALVLLTVLSHVALLNFCYDVPVKLYAVHLWLMTALVALPDARRLIDVIVLHRPTAGELASAPPPGRLVWPHAVAKSIVIAVVVHGNLSPSLAYLAHVAPAGPLDGMWRVRFADCPGPPRPPSSDWRRLGVNRHRIDVFLEDGSVERFHITDRAMNTLTLSRTGRRNATAIFHIERTGEHDASLRAEVDDGALIEASLRRVDTSKSLLLTRGFHWINETPFNH